MRGTERVAVAVLLVGVILVSHTGCAMPQPTLEWSTALADSAKGVNCPDGEEVRTEGCDEFTRVNSPVYRNGVEHMDDGWYELLEGHTLWTRKYGEAELNLSDCYPGHIYIFRYSSLGFQVQTCGRSSFASGSVNCLERGSWYQHACAEEFDIVVWTGSARIIKRGTTYSVTYLPDYRDTTLVLVFEGELSVAPVLALGEEVQDAEEQLGELGDEIDVEAGQFLFTLPDDEMLDDESALIGELEPRRPYAISELRPVMIELGVRSWLLDVQRRAIEDDVELWDLPSVLGEGPRDWSVWINGLASGDDPDSAPGPLGTRDGQLGVLYAVDWQKARREVANATVDQVEARIITGVQGQRYDVLSNISTDPVRARSLLEGVNLSFDEPVILLVVEGDEALKIAADSVREDLEAIEVWVETETVPAEEFVTRLSAHYNNRMQIIALSRE